MIKKAWNVIFPPGDLPPLRVVVAPSHAGDSRACVVVYIYGVKSDIKAVQLAITGNVPGGANLTVVEPESRDYDEHATQSLYVLQKQPSTYQVGRALSENLTYADVALGAAKDGF